MTGALATGSLRPRRGSRLVVVALAGALLASLGCGGGAGSAAPSPPSTSGPLLAFSGTTVDGKPFEGRGLAGKPLALWFWAPWCPTCLMQAPGLRQAQLRSGAKVNVVGVAGLDQAGAMPEFVRLAKIAAITNISDPEGTIWKRFGVTEQSVLVLLDASGREVYRGTPTAAEIPDRIAALAG
jgi:thiol-disulfide isomerase/thioredoxin